MSGTARQRNSVVLCFLLLTFIVHIIGFSTNFWSKGEMFVRYYFTVLYYNFHSGLWKHCYCEYGCRCLNINHRVLTDAEKEIIHGFSDIPAWFKAVQAMECLGLIFLIIAGCMIILTTCKQKPRPWKLMNAGITLTAGLFIGIGVIIFGVKVESDLHYSFWLCTSASILAIFTAILCTLEAFMKQPEPVPRQAQVPMVVYPGGIQYPMYPVGTPVMPANGQQAFAPPPYTPPSQGYPIAPVPQGYPSVPPYTPQQMPYNAEPQKRPPPSVNGSSGTYDTLQTSSMNRY